MTLLIIVGAWLAIALALACVLGRAIHLAEDEPLTWDERTRTSDYSAIPPPRSGRG